ncbi:hypothetical protein [Streptomyces sp. NPDC050535]|uniref:hypothetical protein n=1 Tax=Streptomyces sp. NPDC050535 TaxID=3365626 RepID=UPI0037A6F7BF
MGAAASPPPSFPRARGGGLPDGSYGSFTLKDRVLRHPVEEKGVRTFAVQFTGADRKAYGEAVQLIQLHRVEAARLRLR